MEGKKQTEETCTQRKKNKKSAPIAGKIYCHFLRHPAIELNNNQKALT